MVNHPHYYFLQRRILLSHWLRICSWWLILHWLLSSCSCLLSTTFGGTTRAEKSLCPMNLCQISFYSILIIICTVRIFLQHTPLTLFFTGFQQTGPDLYEPQYYAHSVRSAQPFRLTKCILFWCSHRKIGNYTTRYQNILHPDPLPTFWLILLYSKT